MQNIDFNEIHIFIRVIQAGSFTKASKMLNIPISTVSAKVASLEKRIGVTLIQRTTRQLKLTSAGGLYYEKCLKGIDEILHAENEVTMDQHEPQGLLRITAPVYLGGLLLPEVILEMSKKYPKVSIELILKDQAIDLIAEGVDVAIRAGELKDSSLMSKKLGDVYFIPFATSQYLKAHGTPKHPKDLENHRCIRFNPIGKDEWIFTNGRQKQKVALDGKLSVDDLHAAERLTMTHQGIALLPHCASQIKNKKDLVQLLPEWKLGSRPLFLIYPAQKFMPLKLKVFLEIAFNYIKDHL